MEPMALSKGRRGACGRGPVKCQEFRSGQTYASLQEFTQLNSPSGNGIATPVKLKKIKRGKCLTGEAQLNAAKMLCRRQDLTGRASIQAGGRNRWEQYADTGRGESCLMLGFSDDIPIHIVCGWKGSKVVMITVYVPKPPKFIDPWTRGKRNG